MKDNLFKIIDQARSCAKSNWLKAITILQNGRQEYGDEPLLFCAMGEVYQLNKRTREALRYFRLAHDKDPGNREVLTKLAQAQMACHSYSSAKECLEKISYPDPEVLFNKAICCANCGQQTAAIQLLEEIYAGHPNNVSVQIMLAEQYIHARYFTQAKKMLDRLQSKIATSNKYLFLQGYYRFRKLDFLAAYDFLLQAKKEGFDFRVNISLLALAAEKVGFYKEAITYFSQALRYSPFESKIFEALIINYLRLGQKKKAKKLAQKIPVFVPKSNNLLKLIQQLTSEQ